MKITRSTLKGIGARLVKVENDLPGHPSSNDVLPAGTRAKVNSARKHLAAARAALYQAADAPAKSSAGRRSKTTGRRAPGSPKPHYSVVVGNVGQVYQGASSVAAKKSYADYVKISKAGSGRAGGEGVSLWKDGEILREHYGDPQ